MEMNASLFKKRLSSDVQIFFLMGIGWLVALEILSDDLILPLFLQYAFAIIASMAALGFLKVFDYFPAPRMIPRFSDFFAVMFSFPLGAAIAVVSTEYAFAYSINRPEIFILSGLALSLPAFSAHGLLGWLGISWSGKRKIVLDVSDRDRAVLERDLRGKEIRKWIEFIDVEDFKAMAWNGRSREVEFIVIGSETVSEFGSKEWLLRAHLDGTPIFDRRWLSAEITGKVRLRDADFWSYLLNAQKQTWTLRLYSLIKQRLEPAIALCLGILSLPFVAIVSVLIKIDSRGPVFYRQTRTGYLGQDFDMVKFRTMIVESEANGYQWAKKSDKRITRLGKWLRKLRIDEIPQLWNVVRGEMSFFGPRPERPEIYKDLKADIPLFELRTLVRPGITGWAQVLGGYAASVIASRKKLEFDLYYIQYMSPRMDILILIRTIKVILFGREHASDFARKRIQTKGVA